MMTPAKRHMQRMTATQESTAAADRRDDTASGNQYDLMLLQLAEHQRDLKAIQSVEAKIVRKRDLLPDYAAYVDGVLASDAGVQDDVLMTVMVWRLDVGDIPGGLRIAKYALAHDLVTPERFSRDTATLVAEEVAEAGLKPDSAVPAETITHAHTLTIDKDMPDEVRAKLHKAMALAYLRDDMAELALPNLERALALNPNSGVKKLIEQTERRLRQSADA